MMRSDAIRLAGLAGLLLLGAVGVGQAQNKQPFDPVGRWRFYHDDGKPFLARLSKDQTAMTDWDGGEHGIWRWEGSSVRVIYTDGWDDLLTLGADGKFVKRGWSPEADRCAAASNQTGAEHLSSNPGAAFELKR